MAKSNSQIAFDNFKMWIENYPGDVSGAVAAASDFVENSADVDNLQALITEYMAA